MSMHEAGELTVKGVKYQISVGDDGSWNAWVGGEQVTAESRSDLERAIARQTRKATAKIAVPFSQVGRDARIRDGVATGIHSRNRTVLVRWDNGETEQLSNYAGEKTLTGLTDEEKAEWSAHRQAQIETAQWLYRFEKDHEIKLSVAVREALEKAVAE
jgi:hypothetical protein